MMRLAHRLTRTAMAGATAVALFTPLAAGAQPTAPSAPVAARTHLNGTITDFRGKYGVLVRDPSGRLVTVMLHQGTVIAPTGLRLERGMRVALTGISGADAFQADRVDVPDPPQNLARFPLASGGEPGNRASYRGASPGRPDIPAAPPADPVIRDPH